VLLGLAAAGLFYAFGIGAEALAQWLTPGLAQRVNGAGGRIFAGLGDPLGIATIAITAGVCEELFFRGALQPRLGLLWPAVVFASVHTQYGLSLDALAVLVLALGLGLLRRYANTTTSALCHVTYNALVGTGIGFLGPIPAIALEAVLVVAALATWRRCAGA
jgi:membrane protease YdiL (CAAX protease family)